MLVTTRSIVLGMMMGLMATAASAQNAPQGNAAHGKQLFLSDGCYECHGYAAQGGAAGPKLNPPPAFQPFLLQLRMPRDIMPPFRAQVLSNQDAADIHAYLMTMPKPPSPSSIRILP